jgi:arylsulfatase A-like enzyme
MKRLRLLASCALAAALSAGAAERPNLLVIHTDEHSFRTLGCYRALLAREQSQVWGDGVCVETPHIDALAARGALCDRFYAASPVCTPSRASFVSGRYPQNTGADENDKPLRDDVVTFAEALQRQGYATGYAGKWHLDGAARPGWAPARKFGFEDNRYLFNRGHWKQFEDSAAGPAVKARKPDGQPTYDVAGADERSFATDYLADKALGFIQANKGRPFCFMVSFPDPHGPNSVRPPYDTMYEKFAFKLPASAGGKGRLENMARYFGMVKCIDDNVGKLMAGLRAAGVLERTAVVFTADHGDMCGERGLNNKGFPYETSARVPFIVALPGVVKPGAVVREALGTADFKPTVLGLLGVPPDPLDEGRDASALLRTGRAPEGWEDAVFSRNAGGAWLMAVSSRYKLVVFRDAPPAFYDLSSDPLEARNLVGEAREREHVRALARQLSGYAARCREPFAALPAVKADLDWCAEWAGPYAAPAREAPKAKGKAKGRRQAGGEEAEE